MIVDCVRDNGGKLAVTIAAGGLVLIGAIWVAVAVFVAAERRAENQPSRRH
jgi:hypothetical protein